MHVLVTGANGFLGSWLTRDLCRRGYQVRVLLRRPNEAADLAGLTVERVAGDVTDSESVQAAVRDVQAVFHLAGVVGYSRAERPLMDAVNVRGTGHIVDACVAEKVQR